LVYCTPCLILLAVGMAHGDKVKAPTPQDSRPLLDRNDQAVRPDSARLVRPCRGRPHHRPVAVTLARTRGVQWRRITGGLEERSSRPTQASSNDRSCVSALCSSVQTVQQTLLRTTIDVTSMR
jgi:hypothetical protein